MRNERERERARSATAAAAAAVETRKRMKKQPRAVLKFHRSRERFCTVRADDYVPIHFSSGKSYQVPKNKHIVRGVHYMYLRDTRMSSQRRQSNEIFILSNIHRV